MTGSSPAARQRVSCWVATRIDENPLRVGAGYGSRPGMWCSPDAADNSIRYIQALRWRVPGMTSLKYKGDEGIVTAVLRRCGVEPGGWQG